MFVRTLTVFIKVKILVAFKTVQILHCGYLYCLFSAPGMGAI